MSTTYVVPLFIASVVMTSVMPKGVEHYRPDAPTTAGRTVMTSVMPKGVEHAIMFLMPSRGKNRDDLCDAERR